MFRSLKTVPFLVLAAAALASTTVALAAGGSAAAGLPAGPRLTFLEVRSAKKVRPKQGPKRFEKAFRLVSVDPKGGDLRRFPTPGLALATLGTVSWSADGTEVALVAEPARNVAGSGDQSGLRVYVADADGSHLHAVPGTVHAHHPVLSPDGESVAYAVTRQTTPKLDPSNPKSIIPGLEHQFAGTTTWIAPVAGGKARRLTKWENGRLAEPSSFSPDGSQLAVTMVSPGGKEEVDTVDLGPASCGRSRSTGVKRRSHRTALGSPSPATAIAVRYPASTGRKGRPSSTSPMPTAAGRGGSPALPGRMRRRRAGTRAAAASATYGRQGARSNSSASKAR